MRDTVRTLFIPCALAGVLSAPLFLSTASAQRPAGPELVSVLKEGGYVIVFRHARSPRETPDERTANPDNTTRERQLDETGRQDAAAIGSTMRTLGVPVGIVLTSPTYRTRETARRAGWESFETVVELGDLGRSMQGVTEVEGAWLRERVAQLSAGTNTVIVTHQPNMARAFPKEAEGIEEGDALVFGPNGKGGAAFVGRIAVAEWRALRK